MIAGEGEQEELEGDWEISSDGLYIATRDFLIRRGYCCGNRCRNCPYINWQLRPEWRPIPAEHVRRGRVSPRSSAAARALLHYHKEELCHGAPGERERHERMVEHYMVLLECWGAG